jgi:hypothetical protein
LRKFQIKTSKLISITLTLMIFISVGFLTLIEADGFGVSGSFSNYHYRMVPGETIETPGVNVVFFNNYDIDIEVELSPNGPAGVTFLLNDIIVPIPANSSFTVPIGIRVDESAIPGEYNLGLSARVIPQSVSGIQVVGAAELRTRLSIFGEAGDIRIEAVDVLGNPFGLRLRLFRIDGNTLAPVDETTNGILERRFVPGTYRVFAIFDGVEVATRDIVLENQDQKNIVLIANTVFIDNFSVVPQFTDPNDLSTFTTTRMRYTLRSIYNPPSGSLQDIRLGMRVVFFETDFRIREEAVIPFLPASTFDGSFTYSPPGGWKTGLYEFQLFAYLGEFENLLAEDIILLSSSRLRTLDVPSEATGEIPDPRTPPGDLDPDLDPDPEPGPGDEVDEDPIPSSNNGLIWILIIASLIGVGGIIWFIIARKKQSLTAPEIAKQKLKKAGHKPTSEEFKTTIAKVYDTMGPGTDFMKAVQGTDAYAEKVHDYLVKLGALKK